MKLKDIIGSMASKFAAIVLALVCVGNVWGADPVTIQDADGKDISVYEVSSGFYQNAATYAASTDFYITSKAGLEYFRDLVNQVGTVTDTYVSTFASGTAADWYTTGIFGGKTVHLMTDVDLNNEEWSPIGEPKNTAGDKRYFYGNFNGENHTIRNLKATQYTEAIKTWNPGLFGFIGSQAGQTFSNLTIENVTLVGYDYAGAIIGNAGSNATAFNNCHVKGNIDIKCMMVGAFVGGIVGIGTSAIDDCSVKGNTGSTIEGSTVGGLAGTSTRTAKENANTVTDSTVTGVTVKSEDNGGQAGGLVGKATNPVSVTGNTVRDVTVSAEAGKADVLVGGVGGDVTASSNTTDTNVTVISDPYAAYVKVADGFYQNAATYAASTDFYITNKAGLKYFRDLVNGDATVVAGYVDGGFSGYKTALSLFQTNIFQGKTVHLLADIDLSGERWIAIGYQDVDSKSLKNLVFYGTFDAGIYDDKGNLTGTHKISNLDVAESYAADGSSLKRTYTGLFGRLAGGTATGVKNLTIENATVSGRQYVGAVAGRIYSNGAVVENCHVIGAVSINGTSAWVGGLVGECRGSIVDSSVDATGTINGSYDVGGLAGGLYQYAPASAVSMANNSVNGVTVSAGFAYGLGGLVGVAGLAGDNYTANVTISDNAATSVTVTTSDTNYAGDGLVGVLVGYANENSAYAIVADNTVAGTTSATENGTAITTQIGADNATSAIVGTGVTFDESGKVTGGIFENIPASAIASGYVTADNPNTETNVSYPLTIGGPYVAVIYDSDTGKFKQGFDTLAAALSGAADGETITLISGPDEAISAEGEVTGNKTIYITGTAKFNWEAGWLMVGRGSNPGNGTLIFTNATIYASQHKYPGSTGFNISGHEKGSATKNDGTIIVVDSYIECNYLSNKGVLKVVGNGTVAQTPNLSIYGGFDVAGRPASETESGEDATASVELSNGAYLQIVHMNGLGVGREGKGVVLVTKGSRLEHTTDEAYINIANKGTLYLDATSQFVGHKMNRGGTIEIDATGVVSGTKIFDLSDTSSLEGDVTVKNLVAPMTAIYDADGDVTLMSVAAIVNDSSDALVGRYETLAEAVEAYQNGYTIVVFDKTQTIPEGWMFKESGNVTTLVKAVAQIGTTKYETLADAIEDLSDGDTLKVLADVVYADYEWLEVNCTVDLGGHTLTFDDEGIIVIDETYEVVFANGSIVSTLVSDDASAPISCAGYEDEEGEYTHPRLILDNVAIQSVVTPIDVRDGGVLVVSNSTITVTGVGTNTGIELGAGGMATLGAGTVLSAAKTGVNVDGGTLVVDGGAISGGVVGINIEADSSVSVLAGSVTGGEDGIEIWGNGNAAEAPELSISGGTVIGTEHYGVTGNGTIDNDNDNSETVVTIDGGVISGGIAGIYNPQKGSLAISGCTVEGADAAVWAKSGSTAISGGAFKATSGSALLVEAVDYPGGNPEVAVSGGVFSSAVAAEYCADGYSPADNTDAETKDVYPYTVVSDYEAQIVRKGVVQQKGTLAAAIDAATAGDTVTLLKDVAIDSSLTVEKSITLDLNGFGLEVPDNNNTPIFVNNDATTTLSIINSNSSSAATLGDADTKKSQYLAKPFAGNIVIGAPNSGAITLTTEHIFNQTAGAIGTVTINEGVTVTAGNLYIPAKATTINGGTFNGSVHFEGSDNVVAINGGVFKNNVDGNSSAAVSSISITGGDFTKNPSPADAPMTVSGGTFRWEIPLKAKYIADGCSISVGDVYEVSTEALDAPAVEVTFEDSKTLYYSALNSRVFTACDGATVKLLTDIALGSTLEFGSGTDNPSAATLDLNGHVLSYSGNYDTLSVNVYATVTVRDTSASGNGKITNGYAEGDAVYLSAGASFVLESGTLEATGDGSVGIFTYGGDSANEIPSAKSISISGGAIGAASGLITTNGGAVDVAISGGIFSHEPDASHIVDGYVAVGNTDEATKVVYPWMVGRAVAQIGDVKYVTIAAAIEAADAAVANGDPDPVITVLDATAEQSNPDWKFVTDDSVEPAVTTLVRKVYVAQVGETKYESLADAYANAGAGDTIVLLADITGPVEFAKKTLETTDTITLDLNGKTITAGSTGSTLQVSQKAGLVITDSDPEHNGKIENTGSKNAIQFTLTSGTPNSQRGPVTITGGTISADREAIMVDNGSFKLTINGEHVNVVSSSRDAIYMKKSTCSIQIDSGTITGGTNYAALKSGSTLGKGVNNVTITGGTLTGDTYAMDLGLVNSSIAITDGTLVGGTSAMKYPGSKANFVSGGTFSSAVPETACAAGYIPTNADPETGLYTVKQGAYVAQIGTTKYESLAAAFSAAQAGDTVQLLTDCETGMAYTHATPLVFNTANTTLDLNGKTLTITYNMSLVYRCNNGVVMNGTIVPGVTDSNVSGDWCRYGLTIDSCSGVTVSNVVSTTGIAVGGDPDGSYTPGAGPATDVVFTGCTVTGRTSRYAIMAQNQSTATINDGTYSAYTANGSVLYSGFKPNDGGAGSLTVTGGSFMGAIPSENIGAIVISGGIFDRQPLAGLLADGYEVVANTDTETMTAYPHMVDRKLEVIAAADGTVKLSKDVDAGYTFQKQVGNGEWKPVTEMHVVENADELPASGATQTYHFQFVKSGETAVPVGNTVGILHVADSQTNKTTIIGVPWFALGEKITVDSLVYLGNRDEGDKISAYDASADRYRTWELSGGKWTPVTNVSTTTGGDPEDAGDADKFELVRGQGLFLERVNPEKPIYLVGRVAEDGDTTPATTLPVGTTAKPTWTLIAAPSTSDLDLNTANPVANPGSDTIVVTTTGAGINVPYTYANGKWGCPKSVQKTRGNITYWVTERNENAKVPAGTGFWYLNTGSEKSAQWK